MSVRSHRKNPVHITDTTLRDAHQSTLATRLRTDDMRHLAERIDQVGFYSVEVWGGATFDVATRFLGEDPWDRIRKLKGLFKKTPLQMLLRGQNLVGYRNYPDDVVQAFVETAASCGIDIFRIFDALNDERNFEVPMKTVKAVGKHAQAALCYSTTERHLGGPIYTIDYYIKKALTLQEMGADSLCIKDMAGLIAPHDAFDLVKALKRTLKIPVQLHTHYTSGMASMSYLKGIEAGVDTVDTALAPLALRSSQPAVEPIVVALEGSERETGLDLALLLELDQELEALLPHYKEFLDTTRVAVIDTQVLAHQIPGGMLTNLVSQLREAGALDRLEEVYAELPTTRKELGYPPLVTPTSQIVGIQAVQNVLFGRYKMVSQEVKDYVYGLYGRPPAPIDPKVQKLALKGYPRGETPITTRAADSLEPEMEKAREAVKHISTKLEDALTYALYPTTGMRFLRWKYGLEEMPREVTATGREKPPEAPSVKAPEKSPARGPGVRGFHVYVGDEYFRVEVAPVEGIPPTATPATPAPAREEAPPVPPAEEEAPVAAEKEVAIAAPMPGIVIHYEVKVGDNVKEGDGVVVFEAMKMQIVLSTPSSGVVKAINFKPGDKTAKGDVLATIACE
jgi:pyruvate carboxylase subunit B